MILKHIPNSLTVLRLILIAPFLSYLFEGNYVFAFYTFFVAGFTDGLDGLLARRFGWQSKFGSYADPLADKLLVSSSVISLAIIGILPWWLVAVVFSRDVIISMTAIVWVKYVNPNLQFNPSFLSKINTSVQLLLITACLFDLAFTRIPDDVIHALISLTATTTVISFIDYLLKARKDYLAVHKS